MADSTFKIKFTTDVSRHRRAMAEFTNVTKSAFDVTRKAVAWGGGLGGLAAGISLGAGIKEMLALNSATEQTRIAFETFLGSAEKADAVIANLRQFANVTPYGRDEIISSGRALLTVIKNTDELIPRLTQIGNIAAGVKTPIGELAQIYAKAMNKGKVQAEELNQLAERGIPIIQTLAAIYRVNTSEIMKMGEQGMLSSQALSVAFAKLGGAGGKYFSLMDKQSQSLGGRWSTLKDKLSELLEGSGSDSSSFISKSIQELIDELDRMKSSGELQAHIKRISAALAETLRIIKELASWIIAHRSALASMGMAAATVFAWQKFNMLLNSVTFGMKMLGAIDGGKSFASLRQANDTVKLLTADVGNLYKAVGTLRGSMMLLGAAAATAFAGWEIGKALADLINLEAKLTDIKVAMDFVGKNKDNSSGAYTETGFNIAQFGADMVTVGNAEKVGNAVVGGGEMLRLDPSAQDKKNLDRMRARKKANPAASTVRKKNAAPAAAGKEQAQAAEEEALRLQAMAAAAESLDEIETKNKKALADVADAMEKIRIEAAKDAMSEKIDKWRKNMKQWGQDIDSATEKLSKLGLKLDEPVLKSKEQILQSKKDDLLQRKIEAHNKGGSVEFTGEEKQRIADLEALRRRAAEQKKQSKAAEDAIENTQDQATAQERGKAAQERAKETAELTKKKATLDAVNNRLADPKVTAVRKQAAAASAATKKQQEATSSDVNLLRVLEQVKEILKKGLPQETE